MSAWLPHVEEYCKSALADPELNEKTRLLWMEIGKDDPYLPQFKEFHTLLSKHQVKFNYIITEGNHSWPVWRGYLADFATLLFR
jgi:enterochelin esterase family protein